MRDPNRLDAFYAKLQEIHLTNFPGLTVGQFLLSFMSESKRDLFFPEEDEFLKLIEKWSKSNSFKSITNDIAKVTEVYRQMKNAHKLYFPDWRFGQLLVNFFGQISASWKPSDDDLLLQEFKKFSAFE